MTTLVYVGITITVAVISFALGFWIGWISGFDALAKNDQSEYDAAYPLVMDVPSPEPKRHRDQRPHTHA